MDVVPVEKRSEMMGGIRSKNTKPELIVRKMLHSAGYRYRLHSKAVPGTPDIVLKKYNAVIFINGCFWHFHECAIGNLPKSNTEFWEKKLNNNRARDATKIKDCEAAGWRVLTIWECATKGKRRLAFVDLNSTLTSWLRDGTSNKSIVGL